ncbi:MAG: haloacid dehalogenase type II [Candidatus Velthaea sp.]
MNHEHVRALVFDVFGTVVDWRSSLIRMSEAFAEPRGLTADWSAIVDEWRGAYRPAMDRVRSGERPWTHLDALHRESLDVILERHGLADMSHADRETMVGFWHRLSPWPDSVAGLARLREHFTIGTLSNGNVRLLVDMAKNACLPWDCVLSAEMAQHYKPDAQTYEMAIRYLGPKPENVMMVAAHNDDLTHAKRAGMPTAFISRPGEYGPNANVKDAVAGPDADIAVASIGELAGVLTRGRT